MMIAHCYYVIDTDLNSISYVTCIKTVNKTFVCHLFYFFLFVFAIIEYSRLPVITDYL